MGPAHQYETCELCLIQTISQLFTTAGRVENPVPRMLPRGDQIS